jgi:hypothetical protein
MNSPTHHERRTQMSTHDHTLTVVQAESVRSVRLTCKCGMAYVIPLSVSNLPAKCTNCFTPMPTREIQHTLLPALELMQSINAAGNAEVAFTTAIELAKP